MAQIYTPPLDRLIRSLLLQFVIMLGLASTVVAQATLPIDHHGPWRNYDGTGWSVTGLNADGAELTPSTSNGSAQFRSTNASILINLQNIDTDLETKYRLSYSVKATASTSDYTANFRVSYLSKDANEEAASFKTLNESTPSFDKVDRVNLIIPGNATQVKFELTEVLKTYVLFDALAITQRPAITTHTDQGAPGQSVKINGLLFNDAFRVNIGGIDITDNIAVDSEGTTITTAVPEGAVNGRKIIVETPSGIATSTNNFIVLGPKFASVATDQFTPIKGDISEEITLRGTYFRGATQVLFNGIAAVPTEIILGNPDLIKVNVPLGASKGKITVVSPAGTDVSINDFDVNAPVFIVRDVDGAGTMREFMPIIGGVDTEVTIYGKNLSSVTAVKFLGAEGTADDKDGVVVPFTSDTELIVKAPANAVTGPIMLITADDKTVTSRDVFTFVPAPIITLLVPTYGIAGDVITIRGEHFENTTEVKFGEIAVAPKTEDNAGGFEVLASGTEIRVTVPAGAQTAKVSVKTQMGGTTVSEDNFVIVQAPEFISMTPEEGPVGRVVNIRGKFFTGVTKVTFLGTPESAPETGGDSGEGTGSDEEETPSEGDEIPVSTGVEAYFVFVSDSEINVTVPEGAETGEIKIENVVGSVNTPVFEVIIAPVITSFTPERGIVGDLVTIKGYNFTGTTKIAFGSIEAEPILEEGEEESDTEIKVRVPENAVTSKITVTVGDKFDTSENDFVVIQTPIIAKENAFSPAREVAGTEITIKGENFRGVNNIVFLGEADVVGDDEEVISDNVTAPTFTVVSDTEIKVTIPNGAVSGSVMVTNIAGSDTSAEPFEVITKPEITDFAEKKGKAGVDVVIRGYLLNGATSVTFAGVEDLIEAVIKQRPADGKSLTVTVPNGAVTGVITINFPGDLTLTTAEEYEVVQAPVIVSFTPDRGLGGDEVTIVGLNFENITKVEFNGAEADIETLEVTNAPNATDDNPLKQFTVLVPTNATTGIISVTAAGGTGTTGEDIFTVLKPEQITFTPTSSYANEEVTIRGMYLRNLTKVTFNGNNKAITIAATDVIEDEDTGFQIVKVKAPFDANKGTITLTTPAGEGTSEEEYTVIEPVIVSIATEGGKTDNQGYAGRTKVILTGTDFTRYYNVEEKDYGNAAPIVTLNGMEMTLENYTDTQISFLLPTNASTGDIIVRSLSGISAGMRFSVLAPSNIVINPNPAYTNQLITVTADNLIGVKSITYNGDVVNTLTLVEKEIAGTFTFTAPVAKDNPTSGQAALIIETNSGTGVANFTILKPIISDFLQKRDYTAQNPVRTVTITGANFVKYWNVERGEVLEQNPVVTFTGAANQAVIVTPGDNRLVVEIPNDATTGPITVTSVNGSAQSTDFTVIGQPMITGFTPAADIEGAIVTINGSFFDEAEKVTFQGKANDSSDNKEVLAAAFESGATSNRIRVKVPAGANNGRIAVTNLNTANPTGVSITDFRVVKVPVVTGIEAASRMYGATVTLTGENLADVTTNGTNGRILVYFTGHDNTQIQATVDSYDLFDATKITFKIPAKSITGQLRIVNKAGEATIENFVVTSPLIVGFDHFEPRTEITTTSPARINERIIINGYNLNEIGTISFVGAMATSYREISKSELEVTVPKGADTGKVTIRSEVEGQMMNTTSETNVFIIQPKIIVTPSSLVFMEKPGVQSAAKEYTITAEGLMVGETSMTVNIRPKGANPSDVALFEVSESNEASTFETGFATSITVKADGTIDPKTLWIRFMAEESDYYYAEMYHRAPLGATEAILTLEGNSVTPLPVELIAFNATKQGNGVQLTWATASELDNDYFEVQMTEDLKGEFKAVGQVKSKVNTTALRQDYQFNHKGNFNGTRYYRLKQVDLDGTFEYSKVVAVSSNGVNLAVGPRVYPNPINADSKLVYNADRAGKLNVRIVNMNGSAVQNLSYDIEEGENTILLNLNNNLPTGIYILMTEFNGKTEQVKLMKQ
ncbi:IPT/TIG domain-containing protein [Pontibacter sp. BAB1700]|uniref:IPT/TIG domain-containing protein n=1 Tax=Pontibacter sp. BAB1700 TaxID=1144253 RepID=UPI00026BD5D4|nr:IPT/TIG domain-containing protein [Pontibacter sp. BAB1700]EJF10500.1 IPT/TIG domain, FG-GAP repeat-containing protein [Pontibacter sp. BAB1700]